MIKQGSKIYNKVGSAQAILFKNLENMLLKEENKGVGRKNLVFAGLPINFTVNAFKVLISFFGLDKL